MKTAINNTTLFNLNSIVFFLKITFFVVSFIEIYFEFIRNDYWIWILKPLIIPILIVLYCLTSIKKSFVYVAALVLNWFANIFFISVNLKIIFCASMLFLGYRILILINIGSTIKSIKILPVILGCIPFLFLFLSLINMVYSNVNGYVFYNTLLQSFFMTILGGYALSNFVLNNNESSKLLLISSILFTLNLFVLGIKFYFLDMSFLKPLSMLLFIFGQYILYLFIILIETEPNR